MVSNGLNQIFEVFYKDIEKEWDLRHCQDKIKYLYYVLLRVTGLVNEEIRKMIDL